MFDRAFWPIEFILLVFVIALVITGVKMIFTETPILAIITIVVVFGLAKLIKK